MQSWGHIAFSKPSGIVAEIDPIETPPNKSMEGTRWESYSVLSKRFDVKCDNCGAFVGISYDSIVQLGVRKYSIYSNSVTFRPNKKLPNKASPIK